MSQLKYSFGMKLLNYITNFKQYIIKTNFKTVSTLMETKINLQKTENVYRRKVPYQLVGSLMYLAVLIRSDIVFAVNQFINCFDETNWYTALMSVGYYLCVLVAS